MQAHVGVDNSVVANYRALLFPRVIEEKMLLLIRQGRISKWFSGFGQEAISVGTALALKDEDYILPLHRNLGIWTTRDVPLTSLFCQLMGKDGGYTNGRDRTFHFGLPEKRIIGMISHLAAMMPVACGLGQGAQFKGERSVSAVFVGDGASREGDFHEALNLAAVWRLPVLFIVEHNGYGLSTPTGEAMLVDDIADAASGYGMRGVTVDGNDLNAVLRAVGDAARKARAGGGPTLLEMKTFRMRGHEEASGTKYVPPSLIEDWARYDPIIRYEQYLSEQFGLTSDDYEPIRAELEREVTEAAEFALAQPVVSSSIELERADVFASSNAAVVKPGAAVTNKRFIDAVTDGLRQSMEADDRVLIMGQDIAEYGGVFKVTAGFREQFGATRVRNTPIIESGIIGAAMGLALSDLVPIVEMQYADFISCGFNQIVNNLSATHYRWGSPLNVTIRAPYGGGMGAGPFHSQSIEAWFAHVPGLKILIPATPHDAKGMLMAAVQDPNPVLFFEHKYLYRTLKGDVPDDPYTIEIGKARIARKGESATIVTWGVGVLWAMQCAAQVESDGISVEVVDLRSIIPWDKEAVLSSVRKTGRLLVLHEANLTGGFSGEVASYVAQHAFEHLDAPPMRVGAADTPVPFSANLESEIFSANSRLEESLRSLLSY